MCRPMARSRSTSGSEVNPRRSRRKRRTTQIVACAFPASNQTFWESASSPIGTITPSWNAKGFLVRGPSEGERMPRCSQRNEAPGSTDISSSETGESIPGSSAASISIKSPPRKSAVISPSLSNVGSGSDPGIFFPFAPTSRGPRPTVTVSPCAPSGSSSSPTLALMSKAILRPSFSSPCEGSATTRSSTIMSALRCGVHGRSTPACFSPDHRTSEVAMSGLSGITVSVKVNASESADDIVVGSSEHDGSKFVNAAPAAAPLSVPPAKKPSMVRRVTDREFATLTSPPSNQLDRLSCQHPQAMLGRAF